MLYLTIKERTKIYPIALKNSINTYIGFKFFLCYLPSNLQILLIKK